MKRHRTALSFQVDWDDSNSATPNIDSSDRENAPLKGRLKRRLKLEEGDRKKGDIPVQLEQVEKLAKAQKWIYLGISSGIMANFLGAAGMLLRLPPAYFVLIFHGVISPSSIILYLVGVVSIFNGYLSMYSNTPSMTENRRALFFRRYLRVNKLLILVWILATQSTVFGSWKYIFAQNLDKRYRSEDLLKRPDLDTLVRITILMMPHLLDEISEFQNVTPTTPPLDFVTFVGRYFYIFIFIFTVIPVALLVFAIRSQRKYYVARFLQSN
jgi:hypothetical protein